MQDACLASYNGLKQSYPECCVLMCWYHLKARVDIHIKNVENKDVRSNIIADINKLHFSWSYERYNQCYNEMLFKYVSFDHEGNMFDKEGNVGAAKFFQYFIKQCIFSCFNYWQIFTPIDNGSYKINSYA